MKTTELLKFKVNKNDSGSLVAIENSSQIPFDIKRIFYIFDLSGNSVRGNHANLYSKFVLICLHGHCKVKTHDGQNYSTFNLDNPDIGLFIDKLIWKEMYDFSTDAVLIAITDQLYNPKEYITDFENFKKLHQVVKPVKFIKGKSILLRDVEKSDAEFILNLRLDNTLNKYISKVENSLEKQISYLEQYKVKDNEWYFIIQSKNGEHYGTVRIYDIIDKSFSWGSWILKKDTPINVSIESALLIYEYGFNILGFEKSHFQVFKENKSVVRFHKNFGAVITKESDDEYFFEILKEQYFETKKKYAKYIEESND